MANRFERLFQLPQYQYIEGSPVILVAGVLSKDTETGSIIAQLKFQSVSEKRIKAMKVSLMAFDISKAEVTGVSDYQYLELNIVNGQAFGSNKAIVMPVSVTRSFAVVSLLVVFADGSMYEHTGDFAILPIAKALGLDREELKKQYRIATNDSASYSPTESQDLWQCSCGTWNKGSICSHCHILKSKVFSALDVAVLTEQMNTRLAKEQAQKEAEATRQAQLRVEAEIRSKKNKKRAAIFVGIALAVAILLTAGIAVYNKVTDLNIEKILALYTKEDVVSLIGEPDDIDTFHHYEVRFMGNDYSLLVDYDKDDNLINSMDLNYSYPGMKNVKSAYELLDYKITSNDHTSARTIVNGLLSTFSEKYGEPSIFCSEVDTKTYTWTVNDRQIKLYDYIDNDQLSKISAVSIDINCDHQSFCEHTDITTEHLDFTCTENGYDRATCTACGYIDETILKAPGHDTVSKITKEPTCSENGIAQSVCSTCGVTTVDQIDMLPHTFEEIIIVEATCISEGKKKSVCIVCGHQKDEEIIIMLDHNYTQTITIEPKCETKGQYTYVCDGCNEKYTEDVPALGHSMSGPTCTSPEACSRCGKVGSAAFGHNWSYDGQHTTACTYCSLPYNYNISIVGNNLPYSSGGVTISGVWLSNQTGVFINSYGEIVVSAWIEFNYSCDYYSIGSLNVNIYNSSGTLVASRYITVTSGYCECVIANLPDNDVYYVEIS